MSHLKQCLKCGKSTAYEGAEPDSCSHCGAIYRKVEEALRGPTTRPMTTAAVPRTAQKRERAMDHFEFAEVMRSESIYPTFRTVVNVIYWVGIALALILFTGGVISTAKLSIGPGPAIAGFVMAVLLYIVFRVTKEMSLMLADLSDATVRMAARQENQDVS